MEASQRKAIFHTLDGMRGIAAISVVMLHIRWPFAGYVPRHAYLAVDLFFVMSGFVLAHAYEDKLVRGVVSAGQFMMYRIIRLWPLFALSSVVATIGVYAGDRYLVPGGWTPATLAACLGLSLFMLPSPMSLSGDLYPLNTAGWSLFFEILANAAYCRFLFSLSRRPLLILVAGCGLALASVIALSPSHQVQIGGLLVACAMGSLRVGFSFVAGVITYRFFRERPSGRLYALDGTLLSAACLGVVALALLVNTSTSANVVYTPAVLLLGPVVVYVAAHAEPSRLLRRLCRFVGDTSYAVYLLHMPLGFPLVVMMQRLDAAHGWPAPPVAGLVFIGSLLAATFIIDVTFDRPVRRHLIAHCGKRGLLRRPSPRPIGAEPLL